MGTAQATYSAYTPLLPSALPSSVQPWLGASGGKEETEKGRPESTSLRASPRAPGLCSPFRGSL